jgi:tetratricopeptide (TPR) repeat protein
MDLADELWKGQRDEPILLLVAASAAVRLDNLELMEKDLKALDELLKKQKQDPALVTYFLARNWLAAGRADRARKELVQALKTNPAHQPSLELAAQLARAEEDWKSCLRLSQSLAAVQPQSLEAGLWRAEALSHMGDTTEAQRIGRELAGRAPHQSAGYEAIIGALEQDRDYANALSWARRWRSAVPDDSAALRAVVRLTALSGRATSGLVEGELKHMDPGHDFAMAWAAAQGFFDARAYPQAEQWASRALTLANQLPEAGRRSLTLPVELFLGDTYARMNQADKAIEVYQAIWQKNTGHFAAGTALARLLSQRPGQSEAAHAILEQLRRGRYSQRLITGDRLPLEFLDVLGVVCRDARHAKEAVTVLEEAAERYVDEPFIFLHLGRAYALRNRPQEAGQNLDKAARLAQKLARATNDPERKARWLALATEARQELQGSK